MQDHPEGDVTPCPYMPNVAGNVKEKSFVEIWNENSEFHVLRHDNLNGRCGICEFRSICKGCRARALAATGNQMDEDAWCNYVPGKSGNEVIQLATSETFGVEEQCLLPWDAGAKTFFNKFLPLPEAW